MKILFTKNIDKKKISEILGDSLSYDFLEVIKVHHKAIKPFGLKSKSLIFTSVNGVKSFFENGFKPNENFTEQNYNKIYAVGSKTKEELRKNGFGTFKLFFHAQELLEFIIENAPNEKFLHFCGNLSLEILNKALPLQNIWYKKVILYDTEMLYPKIETHYDAVAFFSPSGVRSFAKLNSFDRMKLFSIGRTTYAELKNHISQPVFYSEKSNLTDLLKIIEKQLTAKH